MRIKGYPKRFVDTETGGQPPTFREMDWEEIDLEFCLGLLQVQELDDEDMLEEALGFYRPAGQVRAPGLYDETYDEWAVLRMPSARGELCIVFRSLEYDAGIDYLVREDADSEVIHLGYHANEPTFAGLSWGETSAFLDAAGNAHERAARTVMLMPMCLDVEAVGPSRPAYESALRHFGAPSPLDEILDALTANDPTYQPTWREHDSMRVCDHPDSHRNPNTKHLTPEQHRRIRHILG
ncbi:hypothetical protein [Embleya hyalina]|uniref:Uncharacterized protein n=1 Tax=Embleya hyalina TaxID=516124 RepID=A0A401YSW9_9ACTN|nr:hypothetical protein [Embleya hyalina]GCD97684.1 hypothetical protein EHYA_05380 [Embleya hyalina]